LAGLGRKSAPIRRHTITARVDLSFDPAAGVIRLEAAADRVQLRIEDDMLEAELRPERGHYAALGEQLTGIDHEIWDRPNTFLASHGPRRFTLIRNGAPTYNLQSALQISQRSASRQH
jgi:hypothetical protein